MLAAFVTHEQQHFSFAVDTLIEAFHHLPNCTVTQDWEHLISCFKCASQTEISDNGSVLMETSGAKHISSSTRNKRIIAAVFFFYSADNRCFFFFN